MAIPTSQEREVQSNGVTASTVFGISVKDAAHIMTILRDTLYSDKVLAVLREYSSNAWDAHRDAGKSGVPIKVSIPTIMDPTLTIRDFGTGLSHEAVFEVYTQYGASTKRGSDNSVGMLGIGSKSGFAYSESFTVTSCHGGKRRTYVAVIDESEKGTINLLHEEDCGDETGVEIKIAVRPEDINEFVQKARSLFRYFDPRPEININLPPAPTSQTKLTNGIIFEAEQHDDYGHRTTSKGTWVAVMGCVPYHIDLEQLKGANLPNGGIGEYLNRMSGALYFKIGEVHINASREELKYSTGTRSALVKKFNDLIEEFVKHTLDTIEQGKFTLWEKRVRAQILNQLHLPIPKALKDITESHVQLKGDPKHFTVLTRSGSPVSSVYVADETRFLLKDDAKLLEGFNLGSHDYLIKLVGTSTFDEAQKELEKKIVAWGIAGIPVGKLSDLPWQEPWKPGKNKTKKNPNKKHQVRTFKLKVDPKSPQFSHGVWSDNWEIEVREPQDSDVFVILQGFRSNGHNIYEDYKEDAELAGVFHGKMPSIYGYKWTEAKPIVPKSCQGKHYPEWRVEFAKSFLTPKVKKMFADAEWARLFNFNKPNKKPYEKMCEMLGPNHPITVLLKNQYEGHLATSKVDAKIQKGLNLLSARLGKSPDKPEAQLALADIHQRYPLLALPGTNLTEVWGTHAKNWVEYIKLADRALPAITREKEIACATRLRTPSPTSPSRSSGTASRTPFRRGLLTTAPSEPPSSKGDGTTSRST